MNLKDNNGLTLTELLVATAVIGMVMAGVATFSTSMKQMQVSSQTTRYTDVKLTAVVKAMRTDAEGAIGDPTNPGITSNTAGSTRSICFRHDVSATPSDYTDDYWNCWYHHSSSPGLRRCINIDPLQMPPTSIAMCDSAATTRDYFELTNIDFFTINNDGSGKLKSVALSLTAHDTRIPVDPLKNPDITITTYVSPLMHSR